MVTIPPQGGEEEGEGEGEGSVRERGEVKGRNGGQALHRGFLRAACRGGFPPRAQGGVCLGFVLFFLRVGEDGVQENLVPHLTMGLRNCVRAPVGWGQDCGRKGEKN